MKLLILLVFAIQMATSHKLALPKAPLMLSAGVPTRLNKFEVFKEEDPYTDGLKLRISCVVNKGNKYNQAVREANKKQPESAEKETIEQIPFSFKKANIDVCGQVLEGSIYKLNDQLSDMPIILDEQALSQIEFDKITIKYVLTDHKADRSYNFSFPVFTRFPMKTVTRFTYEPRRNINHFSNYIAYFDKDYFDTQESHLNATTTFSSNFDKPETKKTFALEKSHDGLILHFDIPISVTKKFSMTFTVSDNNLKFTAESFTVFFTSSDIESNNSAKAAILVLFFVFCIFISFIVMLVFYISRKKEEELKLKREMQKKSDNASQSTNLLSHSILNWNKRLMKKHRDKSLELSFGEKNGKRKPHNYAPEGFDETFNDSHDNREIEFRDNFSEIQQDST